MLFSDPGDHTIQGSHTLTQQSDMGITEAIDLALRQKNLVNGLFNHYQPVMIMKILQMRIYLDLWIFLVAQLKCVLWKPVIIEQIINGNTIFIKAAAEVEPMILNSILGIEN